MFAGLHAFLDTEFRTNHPEITLFTPDGILNYRIFDVKLTNIYDEAFDLPGSGLNTVANYFSYHGITEQNLTENTDILVLATCTDGSRNERLLIFAQHIR